MDVVVGKQPDVAIASTEGLHCGFAVNQGSHDLPALRRRLFPDHHPVAMADSGVDHGIAVDLEQE